MNLARDYNFGAVKSCVVTLGYYVSLQIVRDREDEVVSIIGYLHFK